MPGVGDIFLPSGALQGRSSGTLFMDEDEKATLEEGYGDGSGATADMNVAMIQKGIDMMKEGIEATSSAGAAQPQVVALKDGQFKDANSFHKGSGQATIYSTPMAATCFDWRSYQLLMGRPFMSSSRPMRTQTAPER